MLTIFHQCVVSVISIKFLILASFRENPSKTHKKKKESKIIICNFNLMDVILRWCSQHPFCNSSQETLGNVISQHILEYVFTPEAFEGSKCHTWRSAAGSSSSTDPSISSEDSSAGSSPRCHD